jgi:hypothetical protein
MSPRRGNVLVSMPIGFLGAVTSFGSGFLIPMGPSRLLGTLSLLRSFDDVRRRDWMMQSWFFLLCFRRPLCRF